MKKTLFILLAAALLTAVSCDPSSKGPETADIKVALELNGEAYVAEGVTVSMRDLGTNASYQALTDEAGQASFTLPAGLYEASVQHKVSEEGNLYIYNGLNSNIVVSAGVEDIFVVSLVESKSSQILIKELYVGGCQKDDGSGAFTYDQYTILYNNSSEEADASGICFAIGNPGNAHAANKYLVDGVLTYETEGWMPADYSIWWFQIPVTIAPYSQILVAIQSGIDNTATYSQSVDLSKADYYMYDPESGFNNASRYPAPAESFPADHCLKTYRYSLGNAWPISNSSPAFYILNKNGAEAYSQDANNLDYTPGATMPALKVPVEWIVDAIEVFSFPDREKSNKRLPASVDAGYAYLTAKYGYTLYRNVDKEATEALPENEGKLVYGYAGGTNDLEEGGSTDPSGIDAEASIANGAHIIYRDTNNSTYDFHQRKVASIK